ncbi:MAG: M20/M25/M40 family metallo-hydrolase [Treponema sp.]|nr:M20/M25/M40 family metallo-hydrolase [Treponema sp.]
MNAKEFLIKLSNAVGVSGYETERAEIILDFFKKHCDKAEIDKFGNVIGLKKGAGKGKLMFSAHMDEIGLMVAHIDKQGFLGLTQIGGFDQRTLPAHEVIIHGKKKIYGVIGIKPPHITSPEDAKKSIKLEHLLVDTGYDEKEVKEIVSIGDLVTINRQVIELKNNRLAGKCMDDVIAVASYAVVFEKLKNFTHDLDIYFVASAQEEVGLRGARTAAQTIQPDMAIALEVGFGRSAEGADDGNSMLGEGVEIVCGPNINRKMFERLKETAKKNGIKNQVIVAAGMTGTDARIIQITGKGVATALITAPTKYMHTSVETVCMDDVEAMGRLLGEFIIGFNSCDVEEFLCL